MTSIDQDMEVVYFVHAAGCQACEATAPEIDKFEAKHPRTMVLRIDAAGPLPGILGLKVKATPMFAFRRGAEMVTWVGATKEKEIESRLKKLGARL